MFENVKPDNCNPPGTFREHIPHPGGQDHSIEKAVVMEHRFVFFFWMKWRNQLKKNDLLEQPAPTLVTIDWHRDLAPPAQDQKKELEELDQDNLSDVANFVWARFDQTNDGHILCAAWLNLIGDIVLLKNSADEMQDSFSDFQGNEHKIYEFREFERFQDFMLAREDQNIFFDIDLDYFVHGKGKRFYSENFRRYSDEEIRRILDHQHPVFEHILPQIEGVTLAQEPGYCGGMVNSSEIMQVVHSQLFGEKTWQHLSIERG